MELYTRHWNIAILNYRKKMIVPIVKVWNIWYKSGYTCCAVISIRRYESSHMLSIMPPPNTHS